MTLGNWLLLAFVFWIAGFLQNKVLDPTPESKLVYVPKWIFLLFGAPKNDNLPLTVLPVGSVVLQTTGITMAIYGALLDQRIFRDNILSGLIGFSASIVIGIFLSQWMYRNQPYKRDNF